MPDLPLPKEAADAAEAARFTECWDAVLSYADLCTAGSAAAARLATEAFTRGLREAGGSAAVRTAYGPGRRPVRVLPLIPLLLTAVRATAAAWEASGRGDDLAPDFRLWLGSERAARHTGPPARRPLALRALRGMQLPDAELLWLAEVEALPLPVVARRLGLDPAGTTRELAQARDLFRDRCRRAHLDGPAAGACRGPARLPDAGPATAEDLSRHAAGCADCAEAAGCLRADPGSLAAALADGVLGWGGLAYLERRRRAAEVRRAAGRPAPADDDGSGSPGGRDARRRARAARGGLLAGAALISLLALTASLHPIGGTDTTSASVTATPSATAGRRPVPEPPATAPAGSSSPPAPRPAPAGSESATATRAPTATATVTVRRDPEPDGTTTATSAAPTATPTPTPGDGTDTPSPCTVHYDLVNQWPAGFQGTVTVTTTRALDTWRLAWTFPDSQRITQLWDATWTRTGSRVTVTAAPYNATVPAGGTLTFGFLAAWDGRNGMPDDFTLNGLSCSTT